MNPVGAPGPVCGPVALGAPGASLPSARSAPPVSFRSVLCLTAIETTPPSRAVREARPSHPVGPPRDARLASAAAQAHGVSGAATRPARAQSEDDPLDPAHRRRVVTAAGDVPWAALVDPALASGPSSPTGNEAASTARAASSLEDLLPALVPRIAWSGDRHRGAVHLEIGAGELAGGTLLVQAEGGRVRVTLDTPPGVDATRWRQRICDRLAMRGVPTDSVEVT